MTDVSAQAKALSDKLAWLRMRARQQLDRRVKAHDAIRAILLQEDIAMAGDFTEFDGAVQAISDELATVLQDQATALQAAKDADATDVVSAIQTATGKLTGLKSTLDNALASETPTPAALKGKIGKSHSKSGK